MNYSKTGFILSLVSIVIQVVAAFFLFATLNKDPDFAFFLPILLLLLRILGFILWGAVIIFCIIGIVKKQSTGFAIAGILLSVVPFLLSIIGFLFLLTLFTT